MDNDDTPTCGKGIAAAADLPARLGTLLAARGEVLERHTRALDLKDANARQEFDAYADLVRRHRAIAAELDELAQQMRSYRDLPMGPHDMTVMMDPKGQMAAFAEYVEIERELAGYFAAKLKEDEQMLG
jgi:hypothetical protein